MSQQMVESNEKCETEVLRLQRHFDAIVEILLEIKKKKHETTLRDGCTEGNPFYLLRYEDGGISEAMMEYTMGFIFNAEKIFITKTNSFQWVGDFIMSLEAKHDETCLLANHKKILFETS